jgi:hypothetical protein
MPKFGAVRFLKEVKVNGPGNWRLLFVDSKARARARSRARSGQDSTEIRRAQRALGVRIETEAIERALDLVISEHESNRLAQEAHRDKSHFRTQRYQV